ncbi:DUF4249 family protein [Flavicella sediminum]|uniref:DUF4249 family protein n=1 Tax=Flavicella sediminum TaxID=2585141 RepID=UPI0011249CB8|nr:DUF4249 family protein [Flavicella sediminum]
MKYLYILLSILVFASCEDVIDLPLTEGPKRLVIDANINWEKGTAGNEQVIRLTETASYYDNSIPAATGATVVVKNSKLDEFIFAEEGATGLYKSTNFVPELNETYNLEIVYKAEIFKATETLMPVTIIDSISQTEQNIFGQNVVRVDFAYTDPVEQENYYLGEFTSDAYFLNVYRTWSDEFINGNVDTVFEIDEELEKDDTLTLRFYGISRGYQNYFSLLLQQIESGGPFATPPAAVSGNCLNTTSPENKPLGYFRLSEVVITPYTIQ